MCSFYHSAALSGHFGQQQVVIGTHCTVEASRLAGCHCRRAQLRTAMRNWACGFHICVSRAQSRTGSSAFEVHVHCMLMQWQLPLQRKARIGNFWREETWPPASGSPTLSRHSLALPPCPPAPATVLRATCVQARRNHRPVRPPPAFRGCGTRRMCVDGRFRSSLSSGTNRGGSLCLGARSTTCVTIAASSLAA